MATDRRTLALLAAPVLILALATGCQSGEQAFIGDRLVTLCNQSYSTCNVSVGCALDGDHYVEGTFPGARRVVVHSEEDDADFLVRLYFPLMQAPGTELLAQMYEPDCSLDTVDARAHLLDVDVFEEAGNDRTLFFEMHVEQAGEHLVELFSDASAEYLLIVEPQLVDL